MPSYGCVRIMVDKHDVFLSYSHKDTDIMLKIKYRLLSEGVIPWTDENIQPGTPVWQDAIERAIDNTKCFVVILTQHTKESETVKREIEYAYVQEKTIIPILARGDKRDAVPFALITAQYIDMRSGIDPGIEKLLLIVKSLLDSSLENISTQQSIELAAILMREVTEQGTRLSLDEIIELLSRTKDEIYRICLKLSGRAKERGFLTFEEIQEFLGDKMDIPEIIDEVMNWLLKTEIEIIDRDEAIRMQILTKASIKGHLTYEDILKSIPESALSLKLLDDIMDDLVEACVDIVPNRQAKDSNLL